MPKKIDILKDLFSDFVSSRSLDHKGIMKGDSFGLPRIISAGAAGGFQITKKTDDLITALSRELKNEHASTTRSVRNEEWRGWVRGSIGAALIKRSMSDAPDYAAENLSIDIENELKKFLSGLERREYVFGTSLFSDHNISEFFIGPVRFEPRMDWLKRKRLENDINESIFRKVSRIWSGKIVRKNKRNNLDELRQADIVEAIGSCAYVVSVNVEGFASKAGLEAALMSVRSALACISVIWSQPSSVLSGFNLKFDGNIHLQKTLYFIPGKICLAGSRMSAMPYGAVISGAEWKDLMINEKDFFSSAGDVAKLLVDSSGGAGGRDVLNALMQSILWFYEGCRERNDLLAVVDYAASLDALGGGHKAKGILALLKARLGMDGDDEINPGGPRLKMVLDEIYSQGRSRTIHGTSNRIGHDWSFSRSIAEQLARHAVFASFCYVAANQAVSSVDDLRK